MAYDAGTGLITLQPLPELAALRNATLAQLGTTVIANGSMSLIPGAVGDMLEIDAYFALPNTSSTVTFGIAVRATADLSVRTLVSLSFNAGGVIANNTDRPGGDIYIYDMDPQAPEEWNVGNCSSGCFNNASCVAFVYVRPGDGPCRCCYKGSIPAPQPNNYCVSGVKATTLELFVDRTASSTDGSTSTRGGVVPVVEGDAAIARLHVFVDRSIIETFANWGRARLISRVYPNATDATGVALFATGGDVTLLSANVWSMNPIWNDS